LLVAHYIEITIECWKMQGGGLRELVGTGRRIAPGSHAEFGPLWPPNGLAAALSMPSRPASFRRGNLGKLEILGGALQAPTPYGRHSRESDPRSAGVGATQGTHLSGNDGCMAYFLPEASGLGGRERRRIGGDGCCRRPCDGPRDTRGPRPPRRKETVFIRGTASHRRLDIECI
jgi:hypothetical protein